MVILIVAVILLILLDLGLGSVRIPITEVAKILTGSAVENEAWQAIVLKIRLPRTITAVLAGAALSVGGLQMQTLFRNPLAGPSVLGITAGASLGVAAVMLAAGSATTAFTIRSLGLGGSWLIVIAASIGAALVLLAILAISYRIRDNVVMLIVGIMVANITIAIVSIWQYFSNPEQIQEYILWTFGSLGGVTTSQLQVLGLIVGFGVIMTFALSKTLNVLLLGEDYAQSMGLNIRKSRIAIIGVTSILAGAITGFCGPIGFVGIAVPHLTRSLLNTSDHKVLIPSCVLVGAILMLVCDIISQVPGSNTVLPVNAITAMIGSPIVIWIIVKRRNLKSSF
ncbi:iron ABC transporter permease [Roseivirga sp. E12]|uniref:iron ABC transporter permease n=1 Tax=Roseivirga sp. E12 TaxID=2819237 RepID=UPI001ABC9C6B|nr:iron ABC transporter permease [Roseivirga sp. E12]MBO3699688.1 iron ABC transporter permease [Roseivirga sp. E12]